MPWNVYSNSMIISGPMVLSALSNVFCAYHNAPLPFFASQDLGFHAYKITENSVDKNRPKVKSRLISIPKELVYLHMRVIYLHFIFLVFFLEGFILFYFKTL